MHLQLTLSDIFQDLGFDTPESWRAMECATTVEAKHTGHQRGNWMAAAPGSVDGAGKEPPAAGCYPHPFLIYPETERKPDEKKKRRRKKRG
jgi:hypothetical protein